MEEIRKASEIDMLRIEGLPAWYEKLQTITELAVYRAHGSCVVNGYVYPLDIDVIAKTGRHGMEVEVCNTMDRATLAYVSVPVHLLFDLGQDVSLRNTAREVLRAFLFEVGVLPEVEGDVPGDDIYRPTEINRHLLPWVQNAQ